jgi:hypothetical protein
MKAKDVTGKSLSQRSTKILADLLAFFVATMSWALESNWD